MFGRLYGVCDKNPMFEKEYMVCKDYFYSKKLIHNLLLWSYTEWLAFEVNFAEFRAVHKGSSALSIIIVDLLCLLDWLDLSVK